MSNVQLKYGTPRHDKIKDALRRRINLANRAIGKRGQEYAENEENFMAYMPTKSADLLREDKKAQGTSQFIDLVVPYNYAILMSWHTYITTVFLSRTPVLQFAGRHGETEEQLQAVEAIMDYQTQIGGHLVPYYIWFMDAGKYGVGVLGQYWDEEIIQVSRVVERPKTYLGIPLLGKTEKVKQTQRTKGYSGNKIYNVRPQDFLFDSNVSLLNFQQGEFCGRYADMSWNTAVRRKEYGQYYNLNELRQVKQRKSVKSSSIHGRDMGSPQMELPDAVQGSVDPLQDEEMSPAFVSVVEMHVELIPKDWGLGSSTYPEKWVFTLAEDDVIIESQPYDSLHGKFPYSVIEYEIEGYGLQKRSLLELTDTLNDTMTWLANTHFHNVRAVLNGMFVTDPSRVTMKDFRSEGGGLLIRLKPTAYGQDVRSVVSQLQTADVTQGHLRDMQLIGELMQRITGVTENIMGLVNQGGRKTATEVRSANVMGGNRLKTQSEYFSASGVSPMSQILLQETQQRYDGEMKFRLAGDLLEEGEKFMQVDPDLIAGFYDFVPVDGTMPVDRYAQVTMWTQLLSQMRAFPEVLQQYNMGGIFAWVAQLAGLKNIKRFRIQVMNQDQINQQVQAGNLMGVKDVGGQTGAGRTGRTAGDRAGVPGAAQLPGMGPTG